MSSLHNHTETLQSIYEALSGHAQRLESLATILNGPEISDRPENGPGLPDGPSPKPAHLMGEVESLAFDIRRQVERIGAASNRLAEVISDPRNAAASGSKY